MTKFKHVAFAGITALAFSQFAFAGGSANKQSQSGMPTEQSAAQGQSQDSGTIRQAQEKLSAKGHDVTADGVLGTKTQAAVKEFQEKEGIQASGQLDQETLAALGVNESSAGAGSTSSPSSSPSATPAPSSSSSESTSPATGATNPSSPSEPKAEPKS